MADLALLRRPDQLYGYLLEQLRQRRGPWRELKGEIRFIGSKALHLSGQEEFEQLARYLTERFDQKLNAPNRSRFAVLAAQEPNAFAVAPSKCDGILLTKGAFDRIQELAREAGYAVQPLLHVQQADHPLVRAWGELQVDEANLSGFAALVAHVTETVLVHHEIAHLVLGHEWHWRTRLDQASGEADPNQCLELDADLHALKFTEDYLAERLGTVPQDGDPVNMAWHHFLREPNMRGEFVLFCAFLFLLAVSPGGEKPVLAELRGDGHPHLVVRQLLSLLAQQKWRGVSPRDAVDLVYFAAAVHGATLQEPPLVEKLSEDLGLTSLGEDPDAFKEHIELLGKQLARYETKLNQLTRLPSAERIRWFAP